MNVITIKINGIEYNLKGDEKEEYLRTVGNYVDKKIKNILENNEKLSTADAAILTALNVADDMFKTGIENDELVDKLERMKNEENNVKSQIEILQKKLEEIKKENEIENKTLNEKFLKAENEKEELLVKVKEISSSKTDSSEQVEELMEQLSIMETEVKKYRELYNKSKDENKELKFNMHSLKYKIIDLENKYFENQIEVAKSKKQLVEALKNESKKNK